MSYPAIPQSDTRQSVYIDVHDVAYTIESLLAPVLLPPTPGLYLPNQLEPVLVAGGSYWYEEPTFLEMTSHAKPDMGLKTHEGKLVGNTTVLNVTSTPWNYYIYRYLPVMNLEEVSMSPWDIVDINPDLPMYRHQQKQVLLPHHQAKDCSPMPTLPVQGLKIARAILANEIEGSRAYRPHTGKSLEELLLPFLRPEYQGVQHMRDDRWFQDTLNLLWDAMLPVIKPSMDALRGNAYQMCTVVHQEAFQIRVDQLGDFRIMEWEQQQHDPEYQRWQRARQNGDWCRYVQAQEEINANSNPYPATSYPYR